MGKAAETRRYIIEKAAPVFNRKGIAGTTVDDVLSVTGMAKGGVYGRFVNRQELAVAAVEFLLAEVRRRMADVMDREISATRKLLAYMNDQLDPVHYAIEGGCPILNFSVEADDTDPVLKEKLKFVIEIVQQKLVTVIQQGIDAGELSADINACDFALKMFAMLEGGIMISRVSGNVKYMTGLIRMLKAELSSYILHPVLTDCVVENECR
ncbi:TetR/AcrR family transcriptional regulator [Chitinophaga pendula]|uniref:TetR/AcrR family transcriptional regulator n=1 Tax=Chitinophaga TaxID=79328 RepID=UPI000BAF1E59|nr:MULTISPECIES: TetR/AcrR family transcriptional regulator [Chitinophaga]ASZ12528.1 TetR family transcriptional regulator [Chitinophaga sp. MD30]UCJ09868.1 TetR/AcrR family transcriptional regulator [Chitinophaga pendula]